jgi:DNA topoisomerase III
MEGAGKFVEDEELRNAMSQRGLGTPATRAAIIEGLLQDAYILREGREMIVTSKGMALIDLLRHIGVAALTSAEMTGAWEFQLKEMELGKRDRESFMQEIRSFTREIVEKVKEFEHSSSEEASADFEASCPQCGAFPLKENIRKIQCPNCHWSLWKSIASRPFESSELHELIEKKRVGPLEGFRSRFGKTFGAIVELDDKFKTKFCFDEQQQDAVTQEALRQAPVIVKCPVCHRGMIREGINAFLCDDSLNAESGKKSCQFRTGKVILQQSVSPEQMVQLATIGKTDLLRGFVSKKGRRFSAYLKIDGEKVAFEFEPSKRAKASAQGSSSDGSTKSSKTPKEKTSSVASKGSKRKSS